MKNKLRIKVLLPTAHEDFLKLSKSNKLPKIACNLDFYSHNKSF